MFRRKNILLSLIFTCCLNVFSSPNNVDKFINTLKFDYLTIENGLSSNIINCILQDNEGFIWIGTSEGLNRFDGYNVKIFKKQLNNEGTISDNWINCLFVDSKNRVWVGTRIGLNCYNQDEENFIRYIPEPEKYKINIANIVNGINIGIDSTIFFSTEGGKIYYIIKNTDSISPIDVDFEGIRTFVIDKNNVFWIGTYEGLVCYDFYTNKYEKIKYKNSIFNVHIEELYDGGDTLWIGTNKGKVYYYIKNKKELNELIIPYTDIYFITNIAKIHSTYLFISTNNGIVIYDLKNKQFGLLRKTTANFNGLNSLGVTYTYTDVQNNIWIGTFQGGINISYSQKKFNNYSKNSNPSIDISNISAVYEDSRQRLWLGSFDNGINVIDLNRNYRKTFFNRTNDLTSLGYGTVFTIFEDSHHKIWCGTYTGYLQQYDSSTEKFLTFKIPANEDKSDFCDDIRSVVEDKKGNIWFISHGNGLWKYNPQKNIYKSYKYKGRFSTNSISDDWLFQIFVDHEGMLWLAGPSGVSYFDPEKEVFTNYYHSRLNSNSLSSNMIHVIYEDSNQLVWIGTDFGLNAFDRSINKFYRFYDTDGLPSNNIKAILEHKPGEIWISTGYGLSCIKYNYEKGKKLIIKCRNYDKYDNLQDIVYWERSACKLKNNKLVFGGEKGIVIFDPNEIVENKIPPKVFLTDLKIYGSPVKINDSTKILKKSISRLRNIEIPYKYKYITISYIALNYIGNEKNQYAYKLEGLDKQWNYVGNKKEATFTNLSPGKYIFKVKASNNDGYWNEEGTSIEIKILPPFWKTLWFKLLVAFIISAIVFLYFKHRTYLLIKQNKILEEKVQERTIQLINANEELREMNQWIAAQNQEIVAQNMEISSKNEEISTQKEMLEKQKEKIEQAYKELEQYRNRLEELVEERTRELTIAKEKAEESDRLKTSFLANLSHEIRTPLNSIIGFTSLFFEPDISDDEKKKFKTIVDCSSHTLLNMINDIIDYAKIEAGHLDIVIKQIHLNSLITNVSNMFKIEYNKEQVVSNKKLNFNINVDDSIKSLVFYSDEIRLNQIFSNLISNAIKFTNEGYIELGCNLIVESNMLRFYVKDTGIGIPVEYQQLIFERFRKLEDDKSNIYRGAGLGLTISKKLVILLGGEIWVESLPGKGTTFFFTIPFKKEETINKVEPIISRTYPLLENVTMLIAEDDYANFEYLYKIIQPTKAKVLHAINGQQVLEMIDNHPEIKMIFMDIKMPIVDGIDAFKAIRAKGVKVPIIAQTAYAFSEEINEILREGFDDYLIKPISPSDVYKTLNKYFND